MHCNKKYLFLFSLSYLKLWEYKELTTHIIITYIDLRQENTDHLCLGGGASEIHREGNFFEVLDFAISPFKTKDIFGKRFHETLGVLWRKYNT
jgi:hypothetical protein